MKDTDIKIEMRDAVSLASQQNGYPLLRRIRVKNRSEETARDVRVTLSFDPPFASAGEVVIGDIPAGKSGSADNIPVSISTEFLANLTEPVSGTVTVSVRCAGEEESREVTKGVRLYQYDRWEGDDYPELLACFCVPNNPALRPIIKRASEILSKRTGDPSLNGYQSGDPSRVLQMAGAVFDAVKELGITYSNHPASCGEPGQRIRMPEEIMSSLMGTCLDTTMFQASILEAVGLRPVVAVTSSHAVCGVWLTRNCSRDAVNRDITSLRKRTADGINEIAVFETTLADKALAVSFDEAVTRAEGILATEEEFLYWVDIEAERRIDIRPLPQRVLTPDGYVIITPERIMELAPEALPDRDVIDLDRKSPVDRKTIWERKLLDLSVRNRLLNAARTYQCAEPDVLELSNRLDEGDALFMSHMPVSEFNFSRHGVNNVLTEDMAAYGYARAELGDRRVHLYGAADAEATIKTLRDDAREIMEESGANALYMTIGTLRWSDSEKHGSRSFYAPIMLFPIEFTKVFDCFHGTGEEPVINLTLLEMLRQNYDISIPGLDPLPRRDGRIDVQLVLNTIRRAVMDRKDWDVDPLVFVGTFDFSKFVMWNDIHTHSEMLDANPVTRSLMDGRLDPEVRCTETPDGRSIDEQCPPSEILLPIKADSSQMKAIRDAVDGKSFIVHGPAGTGKSQTITNIIANALYRGKRVLFVSEKKAALEVVQKRLASIGLDPFCLELHSNTATKTKVLRKLDDTLGMARPSAPDGFDECAARLEGYIKGLDGHVRDLHAVHPCGLSAYDCISAYLACDSSLPRYELPAQWLENATSSSISEARTAAADFEASARHSAIPQGHPLFGLPVTSYTSRMEQQIREALEGIVSAKSIFGVHRWASSLESILSFSLGKRLSRGFTARTRGKASRWLSGLGDLRRYALYNKGRQRVTDCGLECVALSFESGLVPVERIAEAFEKSLSRSLAEWMMADTPELNTFCGDLFESSVRTFRDVSDDMRDLCRKQIVTRLAAGLPDPDGTEDKNSQLYILKRAVRNTARGMSLRTLFSKIPDVLPQICPCMLMSPISVAQYLKAEAGMFDLVIFDEASQMPTSEAVGTIARGKSLVVVGDPKQLPPTSFFEVHTFDEENADKEDLESILDDALSISLPSCHLRWHYRSRHESLITFSNMSYYDGRLLTFPSNDDMSSRVTLHRVEGLYDRGKTRQNEAEATAIVQRVQEILTDPATCGMSIGIVTFNINQRGLIERKLESLCKRNREIAELLSCEDEPIFVKSLENVQGDERDIILFSVGFGRDRDGRMSMNFGPLNQAGGWRRLNVAVSRSRHAMEVFSTIGPEDITVDSATPRGVSDLREFLAYAKDGSVSVTTRASDPKRDRFVEALAEGLRGKGLDVRTNIGTSDFRVDIGVVDPEHPERYEFGIICDGYGYASAEAASDREIIRPQVLEGLGWKLERMWIMDRYILNG